MRFSLRTLLVTTLAIAVLSAAALRLENALAWTLPAIAVAKKIPSTNVTVALRGPDMKGHYWYDVITDEGRVARRSLGRIDETLRPVMVERLDDGNVRIQWGTTPFSGFCILNVDDRLIVRDANMANPSNEPFVLQSRSTRTSSEQDRE
ncbi:hypothetical protein [Neorhodopirellula lusitana]|uniref:hypothetical protein n=1 Tax=Neorhodopirellula lusitana TaxID=445327 RepID=UPI00384BEFED